MAFSFVKNSANYQTVDETEHVMTYELAKVFECMFDDIDLKAKDIFGMTEVADFISMIRMFCEQQSWDFESMVGGEVPSSMARKDILSNTFVNLGKMIRGVHYYKRFHNYRGLEPQTSMILVISNIRKLCYYMKWSFDDLVKMGEERYAERMDDLKTIGVNKYLKKEYQRADKDPVREATLDRADLDRRTLKEV